MHAHTYIYNAQEEVEMKFSRGGRKKEKQKSFDTCFKIPALLVGINVTTQAPSCNNTNTFRQQQH